MSYSVTRRRRADRVACFLLTTANPDKADTDAGDQVEPHISTLIFFFHAHIPGRSPECKFVTSPTLSDKPVCMTHTHTHTQDYQRV